MQLIALWCYLGNAEQFSTLTRLLLCRRAHAYPGEKPSTPTQSDCCLACTFVCTAGSRVKKYPRVWRRRGEIRTKAEGKTCFVHAAKSDTSGESRQGWRGGNLENNTENGAFKTFVHFKNDQQQQRTTFNCSRSESRLSCAAARLLRLITGDNNKDKQIIISSFYMANSEFKRLSARCNSRAKQPLSCLLLGFARRGDGGGACVESMLLSS